MTRRQRDQYINDNDDLTAKEIAGMQKCSLRKAHKLIRQMPHYSTSSSKNRETLRVKIVDYEEWIRGKMVGPERKENASPAKPKKKSKALPYYAAGDDEFLDETGHCRKR